jgi:hypothetical protein
MFTPDEHSGASQLAGLLAQKSGPGFSKDPADYKIPRIKFTGAEFNPLDPKYRPDLGPGDFLIGDQPVDADGLPVIVLGSLSGHEEKDRLVVNGKEEKRRFAIWKNQPEVTPVKGKGGGLKTGRGGWITGRFDEVFLLTESGLAVLTLYDAHHVILEINRQATLLGADAMYKIKWLLTKQLVPDGEYTKAAPRLEPLGVAGASDGPSEAEIAQAKNLCGLVSQLGYRAPDVPLRLVVGGPLAPPPPDGEEDYGAKRDDNDDIPF